MTNIWLLPLMQLIKHGNYLWFLWIIKCEFKILFKNTYEGCWKMGMWLVTLGWMFRTNVYLTFHKYQIFVSHENKLEWYKVVALLPIVLECVIK